MELWEGSLTCGSLELFNALFSSAKRMANGVSSHLGSREVILRMEGYSIRKNQNGFFPVLSFLFRKNRKSRVLVPLIKSYL